MEKLHKSCFTPGLVKRVPGSDFSNDIEEVYDFVGHASMGASGDSTDYVIEKKPVLIEKYHLNKVIAERAKGADLKSIIARCERTEDFSELMSRKVVFGDAYHQPSNLSDACEEGVRTAQFLDSLTEEQKKEYIRLAKLPKSELDAYLASLSKKTEQTPGDESEKGE